MRENLILWSLRKTVPWVNENLISWSTRKSLLWVERADGARCIFFIPCTNCASKGLDQLVTFTVLRFANSSVMMRSTWNPYRVFHFSALFEILMDPSPPYLPSFLLDVIKGIFTTFRNNKWWFQWKWYWDAKLWYRQQISQYFSWLLRWKIVISV